MEMQLPNYIPLFLILFVGVLIPLAILLGYLFSGKVIKTNKIIVTALLITACSSGVGALTWSINHDASMDAQFSNKLTEQYGATSDRSFINMLGAINERGEVSTTFTRNGVETDVFIKRVHTDDNSKMKLLFTVYNEGALYPAATK